MATRLLASSAIVVMADVSKYIDHIEEEERRSHPFGVTNVLLNGLNGRKSKTTLDTGRSLTWISFFCLVLAICGVIIYLAARAANDASETAISEDNRYPQPMTEDYGINGDVQSFTVSQKRSPLGHSIDKAP